MCLPLNQSVPTGDEKLSRLLQRFVCPGGANAPPPGQGVDVAPAEVNRSNMEFIVLSGTYEVCAAFKQPQGAKCSLLMYNRRYPSGKKKDATVILQVLQLKPADRVDTRPPLVYAGVRSAVTYVGPRLEKTIEAVILTVWLPKATNKTSKGVFVFMGVAHTGVQEFHVLMTKRVDSEGSYRASAFEMVKTPLLTFFNDFEEAREENSAGWGGLQVLYEMMGLEDHEAAGVEHDVVSAIVDHAHLAWDNELKSSAESSSRAGAKDRPKTLPTCAPEVKVVNPYRGVQDAARNIPDAVGCITRGSGRRGSEEGSKNLSTPAGAETKPIAFDRFIAIAGDDLLQSAKNALGKAADYVTKQETTASEKTMKTSYLNGFKNVSLAGVLCAGSGR